MRKQTTYRIVQITHSLLFLVLSFPLSTHTAIAESIENGKLPIAVLLEKAELCLKRDHLTFPSGNNAVGYVRQILDISPHHPEAQRILREVVARYNALSHTALERAEALREREIDKAENLHERSVHLARKYRLQEEEPLDTEKRIYLSRQQESPNSPPMISHQDGLSVANSDVQTALREVVERYLSLSETALHQGDREAAKRHLDISRDLIMRYNLAVVPSDTLVDRLLRSEQHLTSVEMQQSSPVSKAVQPTQPLHVPVFITQSF